MRKTTNVLKIGTILIFIRQSVRLFILVSRPDTDYFSFYFSLLRTNDKGAMANQDHYIRAALRTFPYAESQLLQQMVVQLAKTPVVSTW